MPPAARQLAIATVLSGAAALAYETLWTRLLGLVLGHELLGVLSVLAGFFAGMALGAWLAHGRADRLARPARTFAILQSAAAAFALVAPWLLHGLGRTLPGLLGVAPGIGLPIAIATALLIPATACLGASLPVLVAALRRIASDDARNLARLYALDTLGATVGVGLTIHLLLPRLGFVWASLLLAGLSLAAAAMAVMAGDATDRGERVRSAQHEHPVLDARDDPDPGLLRERWLLYLAFGVTGLLGLGLEVVGVRVLAQVYSGTIFSFADLLAVWLLGTAIGTAVHARFSGRLLGRRPTTMLVGLLVALAITVALTAGTASMAGSMLDALAPATAGFVRRQLAEIAVAALVLGPATIPMGMVFAHLLALIAAPSPDDPERTPRSIGAALALNGLCAAAAPFVIGLGMLGAFSYAETWAAIAWGYLLLALLIGWIRRFSPRSLASIAVIGLFGIMLGGGLGGSLVLAPEEDEGWTVIDQRETALGVVRVSETTRPPGSVGRPLRRLWIDRHFRMGGALAIGDRRMGHVPLLLAGDLEGARVLFLGLGTGATAGTALAYDVAEVSAVELVPEVVEVLPHFESVNAGFADDPRANVVIADARRFLLADEGRYRVIVADLFHPARDGAASLYAREHFAAARERLDDSGLFVQWLPLHQLDEAGLAMIVRTFLDVFPHAHAWLGLYNVETPALALIGSDAPLVVDFDRLRARMAELHPRLVELALTDPRDFLAGYVLDREGLLVLAGEGPLHEDLRPRLDFIAARASLDPTTGLANVERLLALRRAWPDDLVHASPELHAELRTQTRGFADALALYLRGEGLRLRARLESGVGDRNPPWTREQLEPYLAAYQREPAFVPVRPWLYAAAASDPALAEWLLPAMLTRTPDEVRVHRAWLGHLAGVQDTARFNVALADARERFGADFSVDAQPVP
jgi:spermidine synthase